MLVDLLYRMRSAGVAGKLLTRGFTGRRYAASSAVSVAAAVNTGVSSSLHADEAPIMSFLSHPKLLLDTVEPTIQKCTELLDLLPKAADAKEKHDIIDSVSNVLCLLLDPCEMVRQLHPDPEYKEAAMEAFSRANQFLCETNSRADLYEHLVDMAAPHNFDALPDEVQKNVTQLKRDMESNGIGMPEQLRRQITQLNMEEEELRMRFLASNESGNPFAVLRSLLKTRLELAHKLGYECYADKALKGTMLEDREQVWHFLCQIGHKYRANAEKEVDRLRLQQGEVRSRRDLTDVDRSKMVVAMRRQYEVEGIEKYFSVANCVRGIQCLCTEVFGVTLQQVPFDKTENLQQDAKKFHVLDEDKKFLGVIVLDMFARSSKFCQAGHITVQLGCRPHTPVLRKVGVQLGERQYPIVVLTCNAGSQAKAPRKADGTIDDEMTLMMPHEVTTCFHEFGHALHTIFGQTGVQNLAGTRGSIDFVECWSQLLEQFLTSHEFMRLWAVKLGSREPITPEMLHRRLEVHNMFRHLDTLDQVLLASIDQTLHGPEPLTVYWPQPDGNMGKRSLGTYDEYGRGIFNLSKLVMDVCAPLTPIVPTENGTLRSLSFEHLSSYPAGYYGYLYSGAFAKRIWNKNFAANPMNRDEGKRLVREVLQFGAACNTRQVMGDYLREDINNIVEWM
jgi:intermediate peptidase